jgi:hypothetical protein
VVHLDAFLTSTLGEDTWLALGSNRYYSQGSSALYYFVGVQLVEALRYKPKGRGFDSR